jgi:antitoxin HicB
MSKTFDHSGSAFDEFLEEERILEETEAIAVKRVLAWQLEQAMKEKKISKYGLAKRLRTSRSQVDRLLDPSHVGVTIETLTRAAMVVGKRLRFDMVNEGNRNRRKTRIRSSEQGRRRVRHVATPR